MTIKVEEYAQLAARVYSATEKNILEIPRYWTIDPNKGLITDESDGFSAGVFHKENTNEIVIS